MKRILVIAAITLGCASFVHADPIVWDGNGHSYEVITGDSTLSWDEARALAESMGGHLATITSAEENAFLADLVATYGTGNLERYWLGGYQTDPGTDVCEPASCWAWVTGEEWVYENWEVDEPNNGVNGTQHYLHFWRTPGMWDDMENRDVMDSFVIEYSVPEPTTLALMGLGLLGLAFMRSRRTKRVRIR